MHQLRAAIALLEAEDDDFVDPAELSALIDRLQGKLSRVLAAAGKRGAMPRIAAALTAGEIGYQATSVICHLQERVSQAGGSIDEEEWVASARESSLKGLSGQAASTWHAVDPAGFNLKVEAAHERRQLFISECGDMYRVDGWLEVSAGELFKTAIQALSHPRGEDDDRSPKQRRADAAVEMAHQVLDQGRLPRRNGIRPHISVHTTIEGLKGELGAPASEMGEGTAQPAQWRGLKARHKTCAGPGCDRPIGWTQAHHIEFWNEGGRTDLRKMVPLCYYHHRLVHEGGYQVVLAGDRVEFIPPDRPALTRRRWGERHWAA